MIVTLAIVSAHLFVAALGRRREVGFGKAFLYSVLLTPFLSLPIVLKSKKLPAKPKASGSKTSEVKPPAGSEKNPYGYKEGGKILSDSYILSEKQWSYSVSSPDSLRVLEERQRQVTPPEERKNTGIHL